MRGWLLLLLVLVGVWFWRSRASSVGQQPSPPPIASPPTLDTVACSRCTVHIPREEAVQGKHGIYCCQEHLQQAEP